MTPKEREQFYDDEIAPALADVARRCQENGLSFLALAEWEPGEYGRTIALTPPSGLAIRTADCAAQANGNIDALISAFIKEARRTGHSSLFLKQLGVPLEPEKS